MAGKKPYPYDTGRGTLVDGDRGAPVPREVEPMDIGQPKRIIEIRPATLPVPGEVDPESEPARAPETEPEPTPAAPDQRSR